MRNLAGYGDRISVRPGERIAFKVSADSGVDRYEAQLVRLWCVDAHRDGPGLEELPVPSSIDGSHPARHQPVDIGSRAELRHPDLAALGDFTLAMAAWPTLESEEEQTLAATDAFALQLVGRRPRLRVGERELVLPRHLPLREWVLLCVSHDAGTRDLRLSAVPLEGAYRGAEAVAAIEAPAGLRFSPAGLLALAGRPGGGQGFYGKLEAPLLLDAAVVPEDPRDLLAGTLPEALRRHLVARWDFARGMAGTRVEDAGPRGLHGRLVNMPGRAMKGWRWDGSVHDWRLNPAHYGAIHFHADDPGDSGCETDVQRAGPTDLPSGLYAPRQEAGEEPEYVVFYVRCPAAAPSQGTRAVFLASTATYMAYANYRVMNRSNLYEMYLGQLPELVESDLWLNERPELGDSLYASHADGSGYAISSRLRPIVNMRPNSTLSAFNDDGWILSFLRAEGLACDVVTDEDLDREGLAALEGYDLVIAGNHPEYTSTAMHDALAGHLARGGRMLYLGGNGFYWRIAFHPEVPGVIELRRAEDGSRPWESEPGEYHHAFDGELGGLWRRCGRPAQRLVGVGFTASGFDVSSYYRRTAASRDPRAAFLFAGVEAEIVGD